MTHILIRKEDTAQRGRYTARRDGINGEAQLLFTHRGPGVISADHTEAPDSMRGTGAALALVEHMVNDARANGFTILPLCPYVAAQYKRHPEWSDVMRIAPGAAPHSG